MTGRLSALIDELRGAEYQFGLLEPGTPVHHVEFAAGLTDGEVEAAQSTFGFRFPPDLRAFLQTALPRGPLFPDWRSGDEAELREALDSPRDGILFDVYHYALRMGEWGSRPMELADALARATELIASAPRLIPVFSHRFMPDDPCEAGNPVLSVHQADIVYYGHDLEDYLRHEFDLPGRAPWPGQVKQIRFWDVDRFQDER